MVLKNSKLSSRQQLRMALGEKSEKETFSIVAESWNQEYGYKD